MSAARAEKRDAKVGRGRKRRGRRAAQAAITPQVTPAVVVVPVEAPVAAPAAPTSLQDKPVETVVNGGRTATGRFLTVVDGGQGEPPPVSTPRYDSIEDERQRDYLAIGEEGARLIGGTRAAAPVFEPLVDESIGAYLRRARESRRMPLEEVSALTKIPVKSLVLLEQDRLSELPAEVFARGFIRGYARAISLDVEKTIALYDSSRLPLAQTGTDAVIALPPPRSSLNEAPRRRLSLVLVMLIVAILATLTLSILFSRPRASHSERAGLGSSQALSAVTSAQAGPAARTQG